MAIAVLLTRYQTDVDSVTYEETEENTQQWLEKLCCVRPELKRTQELEYQETTNSELSDDETSDLDGPEPGTQPTADTSYRASVSVALLTISIASLCVVITRAATELKSVEVWAWFLVSVFLLLLLTSLVVLMRQPRNSASFPFTVPGVPFLPALTVFVNFLLLAALNHWTYVRFAAWTVIGKSEFASFPGKFHDAIAGETLGAVA